MDLKKGLDIIKNNLLLAVLVLQPFLDIIAYAQRNSSISFAGYFRLALTVLLPVYVLFFGRDRKKFVISMSVICGFCALHILNCFRVGYISIFTDVKYMLLVSHAVFLLYSFMYLYEKDEILRQIKTAFKVIIITVTVTHYLSYFLKSGLPTYVDSGTGWTGWCNTQNAFSIILSVLLPFAVCFCISSNKKISFLFLIPFGYIYIMNGTKAAYFTLVGTLFAFLVFVMAEYFIRKKEKFPVFVSLALAALLSCSIAFYNYSPRLDIDKINDENIKLSQEILDNKRHENINNPDNNNENDKISEFLDKYMIKRFGKERYVAAYKDNITAERLADNRLRKVIFASLIWEETDTLTKFVGFEETNMYIENGTYDLENDPQAIFFYYGYIGTALYAGMLLYFLLRCVKQVICRFKENFNYFNFAILLDFGLLMISALYTGHLLRRPNSAIYLTAILLLIYCRTEPLFKKKSDNSLEKK